jgi:hypothetical protein
LPKVDSIGPAPEAAMASLEQTPPLNAAQARLPKAAPVANEVTAQDVAVATSDYKRLDSMAADNLATLSQKAEERVSLQAAPQARTAESSIKAATIAPPVALQEFKGKVIDPEGEPLPFATIHINKNTGTVADANGRFSLKAQDTAVAVTVAAPGYSTTTAKLSSLVKENAIVINEKNDEGLAEVVVTGIMRKKQAATNRERIIFSSPGLEPVRGWKQFNNYVNVQLREWLDGGEEYTKGEVQLEFSINKRGRPVNIIVLQRTAEHLAAPAVELLKNGPAFKQKVDPAKARITIQF